VARRVSRWRLAALAATAASQAAESPRAQQVLTAADVLRSLGFQAT
jgi:hypothetical protein